MKKTLLNLLSLCLLNACASSGKINYSNPKSITLAFYKALGQNDFEKAKLLGTEDTQAVLSLLQNVSDIMSEEEKKAAETESKAQLALLKKAQCKVLKVISRNASPSVKDPASTPFDFKSNFLISAIICTTFPKL